MAVLNRFVVDVVTEDELTERRLSDIATELSEHVHVLGMEVDDGTIEVRNKKSTGHVHDATSKCSHCEYNAYDSLNGDIVVENQ